MTMQPEELRALRDAADMSQGALAAAIGMARQTIAAMEAGTAPIELRTELAVRRVTERLVAGPDLAEVLLDALIARLEERYVLTPKPDATKAAVAKVT